MRNALAIVLSVALAAGLTVAVSTAGAAPAAAPETIDIPREGGALKAVVFRPEGAGPFPAVVGMHGCAGLFSQGAVALRYRDWAQHLTKAGFVVLYPDSYGSRGFGSQCTIRHGAVRTDRERVADANTARHWLQNQPYVEADKVALLGWSNGGISVLWAVRRLATVPKDDTADFRSAVALYPGCRRLDNAAWSARIPTLILVGAADDWSPPQACQRMVAGARGRSAGTSIVVYPGAYHDFDHPSRPLQVRSGYAFSSDGSGRIHTGSNPAARADALRRVPQWLAR
jgi:dienelactone hydrolase